MSRIFLSGTALCVAAALAGTVLAGPDPKPREYLKDWGAKKKSKSGVEGGTFDLPIGPAWIGMPSAANGGNNGQGEPASGEDDPNNPDPRDIPPPVFYGEDINPEDDTIVYVIDRSCSMLTKDTNPYVGSDGAIQEGNRLDRAKFELERSIDSLPDNFRFNVIFFGSCVYTLWSQLQEATQSRKNEAKGWIKGMDAGGNTNAGLAVKTALDDEQVMMVLLLSDGSPNYVDCTAGLRKSPNYHREMIRSANTQGATVHTFGIRLDHSQVARPFMQGVALDNSGNFFEVN